MNISGTGDTSEPFIQSHLNKTGTEGSDYENYFKTNNMKGKKLNSRSPGNSNYKDRSENLQT